MAYEVLFSPDINQFDTVQFEEKSYRFDLGKTNDTGNQLIILYMYILPKFQTHGIKVGMTTCHQNETFYHAIKKRIEGQIHELALSDEQFKKYGDIREVIYWGVCLDAKNDSFKDYDVHKQILQENAGLTEKDQEWFTNIPSDELIELFAKVRSRGHKREIYTPRKEQQACIDALKGYFDKHPTGGRFLLNCKMRFGKSYTTYKFCEEAGIKKILILTFVPAVEASWQDDLAHIKTEYLYLTDKDLRNPFFDLFNVDKPYVMFLSLQNFLGKDRNSADTKEKIKKLAEEHFDLVILDEYHFGAWNQRTQEKLEDMEGEYEKELKKTKDVIQKFGISTDRVICLSGTPFKALARGEFGNDNTYTYSYFDEQRNKYPNEDFEHPDPKYVQFPDMKIFGYNMSALFGNLTAQVFSEDKILAKRYFSLNKFFDTRKDNDYNEPAIFIYEEEIKKWLEIIKGRSTFGGKFPYSRQEMLTNNKHTLWLMPTVNACAAMAKLLEEDEYFKKYEIINLSQPGVGSGVDAYDYLLENIAKADNTNKLGSIALTVNKLTIGVTVKDWFSVFVLKDLASPEQYFQSIFRIQTPLVIDGEIKKKVGYVYDFNIDRAAALLLKYAEDSSEESVTKLQIAKMIVKYLPIFMNGDMDHPIEYEVFYELAKIGDQSQISLSKKITNLSATTHALDEDTMAAMLNDPDVSALLKKVFAHSKFEKSKDRTVPNKPEQDGFETEIAKKGRDLGYELGMGDSKDYLYLDDREVQETFTNRMESYIAKHLPKEYSENEAVWYINGFKKGYEKGVNVPIKKLNCGYDDGIEFVDKIKEKFGEDIHYTKETRIQIENFVRPYLNDINNVPEEYRGMLYKRWYVESFSRAVRNTLKPAITNKEGGTTVADANNVLRHILARLVEFLYISVYRETTFGEIFKNADPDVFLEAVGITKQDFQTLNKYHIFEENTLNNYIHEFFVNESLGATIDKDGDTVHSQYRNSFGWFGFNDIHAIQSEIRQYVNEGQSLSTMKEIDEYANASFIQHSNADSIEPAETDDEKHEDDFAEKTEELGETAEPVEPVGQTETVPQVSLKERIVEVLQENPKGLRSGKIASLLGVSKKEVNRTLYANKYCFEHVLFVWHLKGEGK